MAEETVTTTSLVQTGLERLPGLGVLSRKAKTPGYSGSYLHFTPPRSAVGQSMSI